MSVGDAMGIVSAGDGTGIVGAGDATGIVGAGDATGMVGAGDAARTAVRVVGDVTAGTDTVVAAFLGGICTGAGVGEGGDGTGAGVGAGDDEDVADGTGVARRLRGTPRRGDASSSSERRERASSAGFAEAPSSPK
jgi:hypothetical protein